MKRRSVLERLLGLLLLTACGAPPAPTLDAQRVVIEATADAAHRGWWRYLGGDGPGAAAAFAEAPEDALAALGRARLALDALDPRAALAEAAHATASDGLAAAVARGWAAEAADGLRDGEKLLQTVPLSGPARVLLPPDRHTLRVSFLPWLHLPRLIQTPPTVEGDRLNALGRSWALTTDAPTPDAEGLVVSTWSLPEGTAALELVVGGPALVWRGDRLVAAADLAGHGPDTLRFPAPGSGPLVVAWAADHLPKLWLHPTAPGVGDDRAGPPVPERGPGVDWLGRYLAVEVALLDHDATSAEAGLVDAPTTAAFAVQRARLAELQPGLPVAMVRDEARAAWSVAMPLAPALAHLALARLDFRQGMPEEARRHLDGVLARAPEAFDAHLLALRLNVSEGRMDEAARSLEAARRSAPNPCKLLDDQVALTDSRPGADAELLAAYRTCDRPLDAARRLLDQARPADALAVVDAIQPPDPKDKKMLRIRARALLGLGRLAEARAAWAAVDDMEAGLAAADLTDGDAPLQATLRDLVQRFPTAHEALELVAADPTRLGLTAAPAAGGVPQSLLVDTEAAIAAFRAEPPQSGPAVRVLDHTVLLFFANGKSLRWVHEVLAIRSREAAEEYGEIGLPAGARLVALFTRKDDGRHLFAEQVAEKETMTLPDLESGDFVVASYLDPGDNGYLYDSGYLSPRVFFRGVDLPIFLQRFEVFGPDEVPPTVHPLAGAAAPAAWKMGDRSGWRFEARRVPLLPPEGDTPPAALWLPSTRVGHDVVLEDDLDWLRDRVLSHRRRTPRFDAWAAQVAGEGDGRTRIQRLARAVREGIDDETGLIEVDVSEALASGHGNRALVLSAALESLGLRHRLLVSRTRVHVPAGPFLTVAEFAYPLIEIERRMGEKNTKEIIWLDPGPERAPLGFIPATLVGGDALEAWPATGPHGPQPIPRARAVEDRRHVTVRLQWAANGQLTGEAEDRLEGQEAIVIGHHLARLEPDLRPRLIERLLVGVVGAAHVTWLADPTAQDPDGPLILRYHFTAEPGDALALGLYPVQPGSAHAGAPERTTPLAIQLPTDQTVDLELDSDRPFVGTAWTGTRADGPNTFELKVEQGDDHLRVHAHTVIAGGLVEPAAYPAFAEWARHVDEVERIRLKIK